MWQTGPQLDSPLTAFLLLPVSRFLFRPVWERNLLLLFLFLDLVF